eukprot:3933324-Rhodomonas_salina.1
MMCTTPGSVEAMCSAAPFRPDAVLSITGRFLKPDSSTNEGFTTTITRLSIQGTAATGMSHCNSLLNSSEAIKMNSRLRYTILYAPFE